VSVALVVSLVALIISFISLYLTTLRPAQIEVDHVPHVDELQVPGTAAELPSGPTRLQLIVFISNEGAHGGLLKELHVTDFTYLGADPPLWISVLRADLYTGGFEVALLKMPLELEAGDAKTVFVKAELQPAGGYSEGDATQLAEQLRGLTAIRVSVQWTFVRTAGLLSWRFLPGRIRRPRRKTIRRSIPVEIDGSRYRSQLLDHWRTRKDWSHYVDIVESQN
jgi:hypothetical protein